MKEVRNSAEQIDMKVTVNLPKLGPKLKTLTWCSWEGLCSVVLFFQPGGNNVSINISNNKRQKSKPPNWCDKPVVLEKPLEWS